MGILIGMDEAGYGPRYGPLAVAATAWEVPDEGPGFVARQAVGSKLARRLSATLAAQANAVPRADSLTPGPVFDLYHTLQSVVVKSPSKRRIAIADSKTLFHPGQGLAQLERGLHAVLLAMQQSLACWSAIIEYCEADPDNHHSCVCWPESFDCRLPVDATTDELERLSARLTHSCTAAGVRPLAIRAKLVYPEQLNDLTTHYRSKGAALSHVTVGLLRELIDTLAQSPVPTYVVCDKHGGRNFYTALLQHHFAEHWIEPVYESHTESRYEWGPPEARTCVAFCIKGERFLPTALASMTAKYLRELSMRAFNEFWAAHIPGLRPTAGYNADSHRFKEAIAAKQSELGIDDHRIWRAR